MLKSFLSLILLFGLFTPSWAQERQATALVNHQTNISLPESLGPLKRVGSQKYDQHQLGIVYRYMTEPLIRGDIFIYDLGKKNLGTGINSPEMRPHFEQVKNDIYLLEKRGYYRSVKKVSEGKTAL